MSKFFDLCGRRPLRDQNLEVCRFADGYRLTGTQIIAIDSNQISRCVLVWSLTAQLEIFGHLFCTALRRGVILVTKTYGVVIVCNLDCIFLVSLTKSQTIEHKVAYMLYKLKRIS